MAGECSLALILHDEVQQLLDNFASVMKVHVVFFGRDGEVLRRGRGEGNCRAHVPVLLQGFRPFNPGNSGFRDLQELSNFFDGGSTFEHGFGGVKELQVNGSFHSSFPERLHLFSTDRSEERRFSAV